MDSIPELLLARAEHSSDLVSVHASVASPSTLSLAILRSASRPLKAVELAQQVILWLPETPPESIYNILRKREHDGLLKYDSNGWTLVRRRTSISLFKNFVWGPATELESIDLAAHRREATLHILHKYPGLRAIQITKCLLEWRWVKAPVTKFLVPYDLEILARQGFTQKPLGGKEWFLTDRAKLRTHGPTGVCAVP
jgi:hypothetical protein